MDCVKTQQRIDRSRWLLNQPINEVMLRLTRPMLPAIFAIMGLDLFDTYLVSQLGTESLAALSFTIPVTSTLFALTIGLSIGIAAILSFSLGGGEHHKARRLTTDGLLISIIISILVAITGLLTIQPLFIQLGANYALIPESFHMGPRPDIMPLIEDYMQLRYFGLVFMLIPILTNSVMRSTGDMLFAGRLMLSWVILTALINTTLMLFIEAEPDLSSIGKGHLIADVIFSIISIFFLIKRERLLDFQIPELSDFYANCRCILRIALPATSMSLLTPLALAIITSWVAFYGREAIASFGVIVRLETLALFLPMALSTSLPIFVGQNFGAGYINRSNLAIKKCMQLTIVTQLLIYLLLILAAKPIAHLFSESNTVINIITTILLFLPIGYAGQGLVILVSSALNAIHRPKSALSLSLIRIFALSLPAAYLGAYFGSLTGLFIGLMIANLIIGLLAYIWFGYFFKPETETPI